MISTYIWQPGKSQNNEIAFCQITNYTTIICILKLSMGSMHTWSITSRVPVKPVSYIDFFITNFFLIVYIICFWHHMPHKMDIQGGGVAEGLTRRTSNLRIAGRMGSNPVSDKPLFPWRWIIPTHFFTLRILFWNFHRYSFIHFKQIYRKKLFFP